MEKKLYSVEELNKMMEEKKFHMQKNDEKIQRYELEKSVITEIIDEHPTSYYWNEGDYKTTPMGVINRYLFNIRMYEHDLHNHKKELDYLETKDLTNPFIQQRREYLLNKIQQCIASILKNRKGLQKYNEKGLSVMSGWIEENSETMKVMEELSEETSFFTKLFSLPLIKNVDKLIKKDLVD